MGKTLMTLSYVIVLSFIYYGIHVSGSSIKDFHRFYIITMSVGEIAWVNYLIGFYLFGLKRKGYALPIACAFPMLIYSSVFQDHMTNLVYINIALFIFTLILIYAKNIAKQNSITR